MIRYCLELMQSHARHLEGTEPDESTKSGKSRAEMSLSEAWKAKCPYINALDLKRGKNRPLYSYMSSVITEGINSEASSALPSLPSPSERAALSTKEAASTTAELVAWWRHLSISTRQRLVSFPLTELERALWVCPVWEVLLHKLPELVSGACPPTRIACAGGSVSLGAELLNSPDLAVKLMMEAP